MWSQNLMFSKLTEIWCRCTLLHVYCDFNVYFPKNFVTHAFLAKFGSIVWISSNWLKFHGGVHCYKPITILKFIFSKFSSDTFFGQIWSQHLKFSKLTEISYRGTLRHAYYNFNVYFLKILLFIQFWANLVPKI